MRSKRSKSASDLVFEKAPSTLGFKIAKFFSGMTATETEEPGREREKNEGKKYRSRLESAPETSLSYGRYKKRYEGPSLDRPRSAPDIREPSLYRDGSSGGYSRSDRQRNGRAQTPPPLYDTGYGASHTRPKPQQYAYRVPQQSRKERSLVDKHQGLRNANAIVAQRYDLLFRQSEKDRRKKGKKSLVTDTDSIVTQHTGSHLDSNIDNADARPIKPIQDYIDRPRVPQKQHRIPNDNSNINTAQKSAMRIAAELKSYHELKKMKHVDGDTSPEYFQEERPNSAPRSPQGHSPGRPQTQNSRTQRSETAHSMPSTTAPSQQSSGIVVLS